MPEPQKEREVLDRRRLRSFLLGGVAGALAGILLAPRSGRELRGSLANRAGEARERGRETYFEAQEQMRERLAEVRESPREGSRQYPGEPEERKTEAPQLRDVSRGIEGESERSEELRRKVRETRERLRGRKDSGQGPGR